MIVKTFMKMLVNIFNVVINGSKVEIDKTFKNLNSTNYKVETSIAIHIHSISAWHKFNTMVQIFFSLLGVI